MNQIRLEPIQGFREETRDRKPYGEIAAVEALYGR